VPELGKRRLRQTQQAGWLEETRLPNIENEGVNIK
jgi:hypothetical protein